jgi:hypothetical protein
MNFILLISTIISAVKSIELLMPASTGKEKLDAVITTVEGIMGTVSPILPAVQALVATIVTGFNALGIFTKKAA